MSKDLTFGIKLEHVISDAACHIFRVAFDASTHRILLPYPDITGLHFNQSHTGLSPEWTTGVLMTAPLDEFVLEPDERIAFDLRVYSQGGSGRGRRWMIELPPGDYNVSFVYTAIPDLERYDFLAKRSFMAASTKPWSGTMTSNTVRFLVSSEGKPVR